MELEDLIVVWKKQDIGINENLKADTLKYLLNEKSKGVLNKIRIRLTIELIAIVFVFLAFNTLFFFVHLRLNGIRLGSFILFDLIFLWQMYFYFKLIGSLSDIKYDKDLNANMKDIVEKLTSFIGKYRVLNLPIMFLCIVTFAGAQNLLILIPWMTLEFLLWRSILLPKLLTRFEGFIADLKYSLRCIEESAQ